MTKPASRPQTIRSAKKRTVSIGLLILAGVMVVAGLYILSLTLAPTPLPLVGVTQSTISLDTADDPADQRDRLQIPKINLEVPFAEGGTEVLDRGAWHRYPERGNPREGGNFILSAHRFTIGLTPVETRVSSPFYQLDRLMVGDEIRVYFQGQWYDYLVAHTYDVPPNAVEIENPSTVAKLTLYSCTLQGSTDGRLVVEAHLKT